MLVWARVNDQDRIFEIVKMRRVFSYEHDGHWLMICLYVQFNGTEFGLTTTKFEMPEFHGTQKIADLPVYPLVSHADSDLGQRLIDRGKRVLAFQDTSYREYDGVAGGVEEAEEEDDQDDDTAYQSRNEYHVRRLLAP